MREADYISMVDENGVPRTIDMATVRRKLGSIAKQKAPGLTGNGSDLYAAQPGSWVEWAVMLFNVIQHTQITPRSWHVDLVHYVVHKGGSDGVALRAGGDFYLNLESRRPGRVRAS